MNYMVSIKKQWLLLMLTLALLSCNNNVFNGETVDTNLTFSKDMLIFEGCTLVSRGIDDDGYGKYVILMEYDTCPYDFLYVLYKDSCNYLFEKMEDGSTSPFDTTRMLKILSAAEQSNISEIYPNEGRTMLVYLRHKVEPITVSLEEL